MTEDAQPENALFLWGPLPPKKTSCCLRDGSCCLVPSSTSAASSSGVAGAMARGHERRVDHIAAVSPSYRDLKRSRSMSRQAESSPKNLQPQSCSSDGDEECYGE